MPDEVVTTYSLVNLYSRQATAVVASTNQIAVAVDHAQKKAGDVRGYRQLGDVLDKTKRGYDALAGVIRTTAQVVGAVAATEAAIGFAFMKKAAEFDALVAALIAVEGSAKKANSELKILKDLAKAPGLGVAESIAGFTQLRRSGLSEALSFNVVKEFGNANATSGGGKAELDRILVAISQMAAKPYLQGDELLQLTDAGIPAYKMIKDAFGTSDTEELKRRGVDSGTVIRTLTAELAKMPRVAGGAKNSFENIGDAIEYAEIQIGQGLNRDILPTVDKFADSIAKASKGNAFQGIADQIVQGINDVTGTQNSDEWLIEVITYSRAIVYGVEQLVLNTKGFISYLEKLLENSPVGWAAKAVGWVADNVGGGGPSISNLMDGWRKEAKMSLERGAQLQKKEAASNANKIPDLDNPPKANPVTDLLGRIEKHTKETADSTRDWGKHALGGGNLGHLGVTIAEYETMRRGHPGRRDIHIHGAKALVDGIEDLAHRIAEEVIRGHLRGFSGY